MDLDTEVDEILAREAERKEARAKRYDPADHVMCKALGLAFARVDRAHRKSTERVELRTFDC